MIDGFYEDDKYKNKSEERDNYEEQFSIKMFCFKKILN